jgi:hypothetical protein
MEQPSLLSTSAVIEALGGTIEVARLTKRRDSAVRNWRGFPTFPSNTYKIFEKALKARKLSAPDWLWNMEPRPEPPLDETTKADPAEVA